MKLPTGLWHFALFDTYKCKCQNLSVRERFKINMGWNPPIKKKINTSFLLILITKITTIMSRWSTIKQVRTSETTREWYKARHKQRMPTDCHKKSNTWATKIGVNSTSTNQEYNLSKTPTEISGTVWQTTQKNLVLPSPPAPVHKKCSLFVSLSEDLILFCVYIKIDNFPIKNIG